MTENHEKELFHWERNGVHIEAEKLEQSKIPLGFMRRIRKLSELDQVFEIMERYMDGENLEKLDKLSEDDVTAYTDFCNAWLEGLAGGS